MGFKLLEDIPLYKKIVTLSTEGTIVDGVYYEGTSVTSYIDFEGDWEPVGRGEETKVLAAGLKSSSSILVITGENLTSAVDIGGDNFSEGDVIYLSDPEEDLNSLPYDVFDKEDWHKNSGFSLLPGHNTYICIRREKR